MSRRRTAATFTMETGLFLIPFVFWHILERCNMILIMQRVIVVPVRCYQKHTAPPPPYWTG